MASKVVLPLETPTQVLAHYLIPGTEAIGIQTLPFSNIFNKHLILYQSYYSASSHQFLD
jgi:hypothetical protein